MSSHVTVTDRQIAEALCEGYDAEQVMQMLRVPHWRVKLVVDAAELIAADVPRPAHVAAGMSHRTAPSVAPWGRCPHAVALESASASSIASVRAAGIRASQALRNLTEVLKAEQAKASRRAEAEQAKARGEKRPYRAGGVVSSMRAFTIPVAGRPTPQGSKISRLLGDGRTVLTEQSSKHLKPWRRNVAAACRIAMDTIDGTYPIDEPVSVAIDVYLEQAESNRDPVPWRKNTGDADKHARSVLDGLVVAELLTDDSLVVSLHCRKWWATAARPAGALIRIDPIERTSP